jgi:hypothetical protein
MLAHSGGNRLRPKLLLCLFLVTMGQKYAKYWQNWLETVNLSEKSTMGQFLTMRANLKNRNL